MAADFERRLLFREPFDQPAPTLFLDRDGVLIEERHYIADPDAVSLCCGSMRLLHLAQQAGWPIVVITNQSGIARGYFSWHDYEAVTARMLELIGLDLQPAAIYANGYPRDSSSYFWRKPNPGMLSAAGQELNLDLGRSLLIGDRLTDLQAGVCAGLRSVAHVRTGHGDEELSAVLEWHQHHCCVSRPSERVNLTLLRTLDDFPYDHLVALGSSSL